MGYGFVQFKTPEMALVAIKALQHSQLDNHKLELKISERTQPKYVIQNKYKMFLLYISFNLVQIHGA